MTVTKTPKTPKTPEEKERAARERELLRDREKDRRLEYGPYGGGRVLPVRYDDD